MGHSREDKAKSRERIVEVAATRLRESGTVEPGVAEIMGAAGLTHGGFYKHFASRDELVAVAVSSALHQSGAVAASWAAEGDDPLVAFVDHYLSAEHRDDPGTGCAVAALLSDVARGPDVLKDAFGQQVDAYFSAFQGLLEGQAVGAEGHAVRESGRAGADPDAESAAADRRARAIVAVSALVGALALSRSVAEPERSDEILSAVRSALVSGSSVG